MLNLLVKFRYSNRLVFLLLEILRIDPESKFASASYHIEALTK